MKKQQRNLRRCLIKLFAYSSIGMLCLASSGILAQQGATNKTLKDVYKNAFLIGVAVNPAITSGRDKASQDIVIQHFNAITVENAMKAALINPQPGVYNWGPADEYVAFGKKIKCLLSGIHLYGITRFLFQHLLVELKGVPMQKWIG